MEPAYKQRLFTVDEYYKMADAGILGEDDRVELIEGRIVAMSPSNPPHAWCVSRLNRQFSRKADQYYVSVQSPVRLGIRSEPEPDIALVQLDAPTDRHPEPENILLIVEVGDSSVVYDRKIKAPLYAQSGIPEYWVVDIRGRRIFLYSDPTPAGYRRVRRLGQGSRVKSEVLPELALPVNDILGELLVSTPTRPRRKKSG